MCKISSSVNLANKRFIQMAVSQNFTHRLEATERNFNQTYFD